MIIETTKITGAMTIEMTITEVVEATKKMNITLIMMNTGRVRKTMVGKIKDMGLTETQKMRRRMTETNMKILS